MANGYVNVNAGSGYVKCEVQIGGSWTEAGNKTGNFSYLLENLPKVYRVTANPPSGYSFSNWSYSDSSGTTRTIEGNPSESITLTEYIAPANITANYTANPPQQYSGEIVAGDGGTTSPNGTITYTAGTSYTLTATADSGYKFVKWEDFNGVQFSTSNPLSITTPAGAIWLKAVFEPTSFAKIWDGSKWVSGKVKMWNGSEWVVANIKKYKDGGWTN